jgi:uncharacterized protein (DUF427 family)
MAIQLGQHLNGLLGQLRFQPVDKHVRAYLGGELVADSYQPVLVWEPRRLTPLYAFPRADVLADLEPIELEPAPEPPGRVLDPRVSFAVHTAPGTSQTVRAGAEVGAGAAFAPAEEDLADLVILDFDPFDWFEEDEPIISHPHDPFHRIDVRRSSRHVQIELEGVLLADSREPWLLFEGGLPVTRYYLPAADARVELLPSKTRTRCAYKGEARYYSVPVGDRVVPDLVWSYERPLIDASQVAGLICFFTERADLILDGQPQPRPWTPWSEPD